MTYEPSARPSIETPIPVRPDAGVIRQHTLETEPVLARDFINTPKAR